MKKLIKNTTLAILASTVIATGSAQAKTEGNYVGVNVSYTRAKDADRDSAIGYGLDYKYAVNMNNVFLAPGVFVERLNNTTKADGVKSSLSYRYGAKVDLGYDINKELAAYVTGGIAGVKYKADGSSVPAIVKGREYSAIWGLGAKYVVAKNVSVNLEYNRQKPKNNEFQSTINSYRVGVAYNF